MNVYGGIAVSILFVMYVAAAYLTATNDKKIIVWMLLCSGAVFSGVGTVILITMIKEAMFR